MSVFSTQLTKNAKKLHVFVLNSKGVIEQLYEQDVTLEMIGLGKSIADKHFLAIKPYVLERLSSLGATIESLVVYQGEDDTDNVLRVGVDFPVLTKFGFISTKLTLAILVFPAILHINAIVGD